MKISRILPFATLGSALILPSEQVFNDLAIEDHHSSDWARKVNAVEDDFVSEVEELIEEGSKQAKSAWERITDSSKALLHSAWESASEHIEAIEEQTQTASREFEDWLQSSGSFEQFVDREDGPPHHGPPHHGPPPPHHPPGREPHHPPPHHGPRPPHHKKPHCPKHGTANYTIYQLIAGSNYTTKLAKLINEYPDLVETLNSTKANFTVFAPTDKAFEKIPEHAHKPSKELLLKVLQYHVLPEAYPAFRVLNTHTAPTLLVAEHLAAGPQPQRVAFKLGLRGLTVNWRSRIIAVNIFASNGVIHGVDSLILPPPPAIGILDRLPGYFSTLELGLTKTGLYEKLNTTKHAGGTLFAPNNFAFEKLGPKINGFLFSKYGEKYLKALLEYHVVPNNTLYSDAFYSADGLDEDSIPRGRFHVDLPTLLENRSLSVDVARFGGLITIKINAFTTVAVQDVIAQDGVIHVLRNVLIPPKKIGGAVVESELEDDELTVEELKERLEPYVSSKSDL